MELKLSKDKASFPDYGKKKNREAEKKLNFRSLFQDKNELL